MTLTRYYEAVRPIAEQIAEEHQTIFRQKLDLGLYAQSPEWIEAMKTLKIPTDFKRFQFVLVLIDYNPNSVKFDESNLQGLSFADQVRVFQGGFGNVARGHEVARAKISEDDPRRGRRLRF